MPLFALLIAGLCSDRDAATRLFKTSVCCWIGAVSYAQYITQAVVFHLCEDAYRAAYWRDARYQARPYGTPAWQLVLPSVLFATACATHYGLAVPCAEHLRRRLDARKPDQNADPQGGTTTASSRCFSAASRWSSSLGLFCSRLGLSCGCARWWCCVPASTTAPPVVVVETGGQQQTKGCGGGVVVVERPLSTKDALVAARAGPLGSYGAIASSSPPRSAASVGTSAAALSGGPLLTSV
mmetsp:Transcript_737/g.2932  ORF Transcript_737/g.2932 Transcript_737/m.2932 type:complete len:239 (+) Transcript_737:539-1255(+)